MRIAFLLGSPDINGGTYVIYEHGTRFLDFGHDVTVVTQQFVTPDRYAWHERAQELTWLTLDKGEKESFDIVIATWWQSPFLLHNLEAEHYVYFVQSIESRFFEEEDPQHHDNRDLSIWKKLCESTYSFNIPVITEANWIQDYLYKNYNNRPFLVRNGIRKDLYQAEVEPVSHRQEGRLRVLVEGPVDVFYKNVPKSIELCRKAGVDEVWLLTSSNITSFSGVDRVFSRVPIQETGPIYRSCDVLLKLSYIEGMFGPPLEMFHCGGTAIVYDVTGHDEYIVHKQNSLVVQRDDDDQVVAYLEKLANDKQMLEQLKQGAMQTASAWPDWQSSSSEFEKVLLQIREERKTSRSYLRRWTGKLTEDNTARLQSREMEIFSKREKEQGSETEHIENFVQFYWHDGDGWSQEKFKWAHFSSGEKVSIDFNTEITGHPFWLRLDPGVHPGVVEIFSVVITNTSTQEEVMRFDHPDDFAVLYMSGTVSRLTIPERAVFFSWGNDPQLILPAVEAGNIGDNLHITISLKEMGICSFFETYSRSLPSTEQVSAPSFLKRLLRS